MNADTWYVRPDGDDAGPGTEARPFRTIGAAREAVRRAIREQAEGLLEVVVGEGTYELEEPLRFGADDAGGERCRVVYRNEDGASPVLLGGSALAGWVPWRDGVWRTSVPKGMRFHTLYADGERVSQARLPATGYYHTDAGAGGDDEREGIVVREADLPRDGAFEVRGVRAVVWPGRGEWNWFAETIPVRAFEAAERKLLFDRPASWGIGEGSRYYLQGSLAFLREPGQFHLDEEAGFVYYRPRSGTPETQRIVAPRVARLVEIEGESPERRVSGLSIRGLTLACTDGLAAYRLNGDDGGANAEPDAQRQALVYIRNADGIEIADCRLLQSGSCGVLLDRCVQGARIVRNRIEHVGYNGIYSLGYAPGEGAFDGPAAANLNFGHTIADNVIVSGGELIGHGSGIQLYQSGGCDIAHNRIARVPRYGISLKGMRQGTMPPELWGTPVTWDNHWDFLFSRDNLIRGNDISETMTDSQDGGMIEAWGPGLGNKIVGNRLHHSGIHFSFGFGIYLDDAADDFEVSGNVLDHLYSTGEGKLWMTIFAKGIGNRIVNNLMVDNPDAINAIGTQEMVGEANRDLIIERNIAANSGYPYCFVNWTPERLRSADRNLFWREGTLRRVTGELAAKAICESPAWGYEYEWDDWQRLSGGRFDGRSRFEPPVFAPDADRERGDYRLDPASPAHALGWEEIDYTRFGPRGG